MVSLFRASRFCAAFTVAAVMLTSAPSRSFAESGSVRIRVTNVGFIVGVGGGSGTLTFRGHRYPIRIQRRQPWLHRSGGSGPGWYSLPSANCGGYRGNLFRGLCWDCGSGRRKGSNASELKRRSADVARTAGRFCSQPQCKRDDHILAVDPLEICASQINHESGMSAKCQ